jgi:hypothetical protein
LQYYVDGYPDTPTHKLPRDTYLKFVRDALGSQDRTVREWALKEIEKRSSEAH